MEKVEWFLNEGKPFDEWLRIRVYEPEQTAEGIVWHLRRNAPEKLKNILTIGVFDGHALLIKKY